MKVTLVAPQDISLVVGGLRTQVLETARHLPSYQIEVDFFDPWMVYDQSSTDLFHLFAANASSFHLASTLKNSGIPFVVSPVMYSNHGPSFIRASRQIEKWSKKLFSGLWTDYSVIGDTCHMSQHILPNTLAEAELIEKGFDISPQKISVVPNGVENRFTEADPELFHDTYKIRDFVLFVGTIGSRRKNVWRLIQALDQLGLDGVFIGNTLDNESGRKCREAIQSRDQLHLIDPISHEDPMLASAYAASRVFILPSYYETPGIAAMEAALAGSAIAITERGGTREYFSKFAHYLKPESVTSIQEALHSAWQNPPGEQLKEHISRHFSWTTIAEKTANIYNQLNIDGS
jgi:glycosyltransferase involved in cell wall biosynthesis